MEKYNLEYPDISKPVPIMEPERQYYYMSKCKAWLTKTKEYMGRPLTMCTQTFGCQMNAHDSEKIIAILKLIGFEPIDTEDADFVIYNTCTVRENANQRVYGRLGRLKNLKTKKPNMMIALCGCMMQESNAVNTIRKSYSFVDIVFGTHNIFKLAELLYHRIESGEMIVDIWNDTTKIVENLPIERKYPFKAGINIMYGCNNFCSYCIVPYVRGRERSRNPEDIIHEIKNQVQDGVVEIMLLGQNVNSYGKNLSKPISFAQLLYEIEKIEGLERIRFMTSHPKDLSDDLVEVMKQSKKICRHLHLPVQSGSSRILKIMNRNYSKEQYLNLVNTIRNAIPDISLTTDIIVGFPGETEEDFLETLDIVKTVRFDSAFTFIYSKRTGTPAADMNDQIDENTIKDRFDRLLKTVSEISSKVAVRYEGTIQKILIEDVNHQLPNYVTGRMSNNMLVHIPGDASMIGKILEAKLTQCKGFYYMGEL